MQQQGEDVSEDGSSCNDMSGSESEDDFPHLQKVRWTEEDMQKAIQKAKQVNQGLRRSNRALRESIKDLREQLSQRDAASGSMDGIPKDVTLDSPDDKCHPSGHETSESDGNSSPGVTLIVDKETARNLDMKGTVATMMYFPFCFRPRPSSRPIG